MTRLEIFALPPVLTTTALLLACATGGNPFGDEATAGDADRPEVHRVRFEVSCDTCAITWGVGAHGGRTADRLLWSERVRVRATYEDPVTAHLMVTPLPGAGPISWIRIRVDGDVIVEASTEPVAGAEQTAQPRPLSVRTRVPPPPGSRVIADAGAQEACDGPPTTTAMRSCQEARLALVEEELSALLEQLGGMVGDDRGDLLRDSQRTWEEHRTAHCRFVSARYEGGSLQPVLLTGCFREITAARVEELRHTLEVERGEIGAAETVRDAG